MKYFVCGDIHGRFNELKEALGSAGYESANDNHKIVSVGDTFDRGEQPYEVWRFLKQEKAEIVMGNHELLLRSVIKQGMLYDIDYQNGLGATIAGFGRIFGYSVFEEDLIIEGLRKRGFVDWVENLPGYFETKTHIIMHAGLDTSRNLSNWRNHSFNAWRDHVWTRTPEFLANIQEYKDTIFDGKKLLVGHWHASRLGAEKGQILEHENFAALDLSDYEKVGVYVFEEE